ncbi:hypothetical protein [Metabacillus sediminilitoris]|uniref:Uncharacterized protein n=1 Tax=Metabacillus sediminilitoris TaxID=2567941 RepID=A0A4V3WG79_9BACI|nr:hypothetical protein [Metabacillus sediminilitoris]QGQ47026.1 hypothetical protein GMB29_18325 [Metabacillus sediminilitoris]THF83173.1 hypothetical protein E6W99_02060 [Metabacillus sediminilitoris]
MTLFRGDAHKFFLKLKETTINQHSLDELSELIEIAEIQSFYQNLNSSTLKRVYYRVLKEENGMGMIPIFISAGPWVLFLFSKQLQELLFKNGVMPFFIFITIYLLILVVSVILHFREKAWAAIHATIIKDILTERKAESN